MAYWLVLRVVFWVRFPPPPIFKCLICKHLRHGKPHYGYYFGYSVSGRTAIHRIGGLKSTPRCPCPSRKCHRAHSQRARLKLRGGDLRVEPMRVVASRRQRCHLWICVQTGRIDRERNANGESEFRPRGDKDDAIHRLAESQQLGRGRGARPLARLASFVLTPIRFTYGA